MKSRPAFLKKIENAIIAIDSVLLVVIVILVTIQVIARKLSISMSGTEELSRYSYVIFAFLAWPVAALNGSDVAVTFIFDKLPKKLRSVLIIIYHIAMSIFACVAAYSMTLNAKNAAGVTGSSNTWLMVSWIYWIVFFGLVLTVIANLVRAYFLATGVDEYVSQDEKDMRELEESVAAARALEEAEQKGGSAS